jgi:cytochrome P450
MLSAQIRSTFSSLEEIVPSPKLNSIRFLRACVDESMRLSPPVPALLPREVMHGGMEIAGHYVPAGMVVGVPTYSLHRNTLYFPEPLAYRPERWLVDEVIRDGEVVKRDEGSDNSEQAKAVKTMQSAFAPFSIGSRGCIGKGIAYLELTVALARTLWLYDLRLVKGLEGRGMTAEGHYNLRDIFVAEKVGPVVQFRRRDGVE